MITTYHRPQTLDEALNLLTKANRIPLGGGTLLSKPTADSIEVVDLQALSLDSIKKNGNYLELGATFTLQQMLESDLCPAPLRAALKLEATLNIRNASKIAGTLVACDGRSTFASMLLAADAKIEQANLKDSQVEYQTTNIGAFLPLRPTRLITKIGLPLNIRLAFDYVARTPSDKPIVCAALGQWNSGRTRLVLGGYGKNPLLAMDGTEAEGVEVAARNAFHEAADDYASAEYRMDVAATLAKRCLEALSANS